MYKRCKNCGNNFQTKDSRQQSCSKSCADVRRALNAWRPAKSANPHSVSVQSLPKVDRPSLALPPPEELPAPYAKRVHDMWAALTGEAPTRIA